MSARRRQLEWVGGRLPLPCLVMEPTPHRPDVIVWLSLPEDLVVLGEVIDPVEPVSTFGQSLLQAMRAPIAGPPRRPACVRVADEELADEVRAVVGNDIEVVVAPTPELDALIELMAAAMSRADAGYLEGGTLSEELVAELFAAAHFLYTMAPWQKGADEELVRLDIPALDVCGACLTTMGSLGETSGINIFPSPDHMFDFLDAAAAMMDEMDERATSPPAETGRDFGSDVLSLTYESLDELPALMRAEAEEHGWEVAGPRAYPLPLYRAPDGSVLPLDENLMRALAATSTALATFCMKHGHLFGQESFDPVCESFFDPDDLEVRLTLPYDAWPAFDVNDPPAADAFVHLRGPWQGDLFGDPGETGNLLGEDTGAPSGWAAADGEPADQQRIRRQPTTPSRPRGGRNDPCPCGSGKKYKKCCLDRDTRNRGRRSAPPIGRR